MDLRILVVEKTESCSSCDFENGHYCGIKREYIDECDYETIPDMCPFIDLPEKSKMGNIDD